jgi:hypothetical protein
MVDHYVTDMAKRYGKMTQPEKSEKTEKDIEEKIINYYTLNDKSLSFLKKRTAQLIYLESNIDYTLKVLLPPPEQYI